MLVLALSINLNAQAEEKPFYFDFSTESDIIPFSKELTVILITGSEINAENWAVKPSVGSGTAKIYNEKTKRWILSTDSWTKQPKYKKKFLVKIHAQEEKVKLKFLLKNLKNNETFETPEREIWTNKAYNGYSLQINENIRQWRQNKTNVNVPEIEKEAPVESQTENFKLKKGKENLMIVNLTGFCAACLLGFFMPKDDKIAL